MELRLQKIACPGCRSRDISAGTFAEVTHDLGMSAEQLNGMVDQMLVDRKDPLSFMALACRSCKSLVTFALCEDPACELRHW